MKTLGLKIRTNNTIIISCVAALILLSIFNANAQLCSNGSIQTIYNGSQSGFKTERLGTGFINDPYWYRLYAGCMKIATLRDNGGTNLAVADDNNNWNDSYNNAIDRLKMVAASAHWAAQKSFQYFDDIHGHRGLRGIITSSTTDLRVVTNLGSHFYTDLHAQDLSQFGGTINHAIVCGRRNNRDWVSLDMIGRQYAKGIIFWTSKVGFDNHITPVNSESGALLDAFGDIFGTMIEKSVEGNGFDWTIGEDMGQNYIRRNMANPNSKGHPDTYQGNNWSNSNDRYINCNVINYWFYLLAQGGTGSNDNGDQYTVNGIGTTKARRIVFDAFTDEFSRTTNFAQAAVKTIQKAQSIYGANSNEAIQVCNAWYAVGVRNQPCSTSNNGGGNTASMSLPNSVTQPNGFSVTFNTSGYQAGSLRLVIYDGGNYLRVNSSQNGTSGTINISSTTGWVNGVCRVFLAHTPTNNAILASETITLNQISQTANISSLGTITSPAGFTVTYSSNGYQAGDRFRFKVYDGNNDLKHTSNYIYANSGTLTVPSTSGYASGSCSIKLYDKNNDLKDTEIFTLNAPQLTANISSLGTITAPAGFTVTYSSNGYQAGDRFRFKVYDGNNDLKHTSNYIYANSGTLTVPSTSGYASGTCSIKLYDKNNILKDTEQWFLEDPAVTYCESHGTISDSLWINSVALGNIQNSSGDDNGYGDYSNLSDWTLNSFPVSIISPVLTDNMDITLDPGFATYFAGTDFIST
ncbi:MAG TPA: hypothetical protein EYN89_12345, partial [Flavobacteriales bacterium]|nr:hypothetical protein [Flavobacteriales bacterium]